LAPDAAAYVAKWGPDARRSIRSARGLRAGRRAEPYYSWAWLQLGLLADAQNDDSRAERLLLKSADTDKGLDPSGSSELLLPERSARAILVLGSRGLVADNPESRAGLQAGMAVQPDAGTIMSKALPPAKRRESAFSVRPAREAVDAASPIALAILHDSKHLPRELLMTYCDRQIEVATSVRRWPFERLCDRNLHSELLFLFRREPLIRRVVG